MSTNFKSTSISITADFVCCTVPDYEESVQTIIFTTSDKFEEWFKKDAFLHSKWDNDQGSSSNELEVMRPKKARITMKSSINLMESYHNQLKTFYLGRSRSLRVDRLIYLLYQVVALDYWQDTIKAAHDFGGVRLTANEKKKRRAAYCIDYVVACSMVEQLEENVYQCRSFTEENLFYEMDTKEGFLKNCSCPDQTKMCKHIFLVSRVTKLPFSPRAPVPVAQQERFSAPKEDQGLLCREI
ncbi:hypothetical protein G6F71_005016 [Rhizopus microsporus]|nr:hypothetical protein G6F71_005016 [Rhizopus microsporus]KAG1211051.1 hypothetical protein G6F69_004928 [Rhizopus microsporus]